MIELTKYQGPFGIPVLHQQMPEMVKSVALSWIVFTGSADDLSVGHPGLYHWFEHVPFRGTVKYPGGYAATKGWANRYGGIVGAYTNSFCTVYKTHVPIEIWKKGFDVITDLLAQPLIREEDVNAERDIIRQEIVISMSNPNRRAYIEYTKILFGSHPFGHPVLGTEKTLDLMDAQTLRTAYTSGYDRSRSMLVAIGNIPFNELDEQMLQYSSILPNNRLSERRKVVPHGDMPVWKTGETVVETKFESSVVMLLFALRSDKAEKVFYDASALYEVFQSGAPASPLYRIVREERRLAYGVSCFHYNYPQMTVFGFQAEVKKANIELVIRAFHDVVEDKYVYSQARLDEVKQCSKYENYMRSINPLAYSEVALECFRSTGKVINDADYQAAISGYTTDNLLELKKQLQPELGHVIVLKGTS